MKISICLITYNQEVYIAQAIRSAVMQQTKFDYEVVIGDDYSTDRTRHIVLDFKSRYPDKIRLLLHEKNVGMMANFIQTLKACQGEYIALLEGDDYWTDSLKLQKQVDFLDANPDFAICFHTVQVIYQDNPQQPHLSNRNQKAVSTIEDLLRGNFIQTASCVFRNNLRGELPAWFSQLSVGDWPLHVLNAQFGKIGYLDEVMAVYRVHEGGAWMGQNDLYRLKHFTKAYNYLDEHLQYRYHHIIAPKIARRLQDAARLEKESGNKETADAYFSESWEVISSVGLLARGILFFRRYTPRLYQLLITIKQKLNRIFSGTADDRHEVHD